MLVAALGVPEDVARGGLPGSRRRSRQV